MNTDVSTTSPKTELNRSIPMRFVSGLLFFIGILSFQIISWWALLAFGVMALLDWSSTYWITKDYIQKGNRKILFSEMDVIRKFLWWHIIIDRYDDTIWVAIGFLDRESKAILLDRVGIANRKE